MIVPCLPSISPVVIGGVDTHKELHVTAVVDSSDVVLGTEMFATTRAGYRAMLKWMRSFGDVKRIGVECTGSYGAGLLRFLENAGIEVLEVTAPDKSVRRKKGKDDTLMRRMLPTLPTLGFARSRPEHVTAWLSPCAS